MSPKKKYTNWARYENGRDNELRKLVMTLKDVIYSLDPPYEMKWKMILQKYMRPSEREFISLIKSMDWILDEIGLRLWGSWSGGVGV